MASIWMVREDGSTPPGEPWRTMSIEHCCEKLGLEKSDFFCDLDHPPGPSGPADDIVARVRGPRRVVVEIGIIDQDISSWRPGFYMLKLSPDEVISRCSVEF